MLCTQTLLPLKRLYLRNNVNSVAELTLRVNSGVPGPLRPLPGCFTKFLFTFLIVY